MQECNVAIIGGGPAGVLSAAQFAKLGANVTVYERRSLHEQQDPGIGWSIALGGVACQAIQAAGLSSDFGPLKRSHGITIKRGLAAPVYLGWEAAHTEKNTVSSYIITRLAIVNHIQKQCESMHGDRITFADGYSLVGGNLAQGEAVFIQSNGAEDEAGGGNGNGNVGEGENAGEVRVKADIIIAADGAGSKARQLLQEQEASLKVNRSFIQVSTEPFNLPRPSSAAEMALLETPCGHPYVCVPEDPPQTVTGSFAAFNYPVKSAHADKAIVSFMLGFRDAGADFGGSLTCWSKWWETERSEEEMLKLLEASFPQLPRLWLQTCASTCAKPKNLRTPSIVFTSHLGIGRCVLVGDAAHAVSPQIGVGCTSGLADSALLATLVATLCGSEIGAAALADLGRAWSKLRMHDARAYVRMAKSMNDFAYPQFHKNPFLYMLAAPEALPMLLFRTRFPGRRFIDPGPRPSVALVNGGMAPAEVQRTFRNAFWKLVAGVVGVTAVTGVAVVYVSKLAIRCSTARK